MRDEECGMRDESFEFCFRPELKPKGVLSFELEERDEG
jgi:hypothetical protein